MKQTVYIVQQTSIFASQVLHVFADETDALREANKEPGRTCVPHRLIPKGGKPKPIKPKKTS